MAHPCRTALDTAGNPKYKIHACDSDKSTETTCGLTEVIDVDIVGGWTSLCRTCYPRVREEALTQEDADKEGWTQDAGKEGWTQDEGAGEEPWTQNPEAREEPWTKEGGGNPGDAIEGRTGH